MEQSQPVPPPLRDPDHPPRMSLLARLLNVFAVPGQVFIEMREAPFSVSNWLIPTLLGAVVGGFYVCLVLSQPSLQKEFKEKQMAVIQERVKSGKLTPEERAMAERFTGPIVLKLFGGAGAVLGSFLTVFGWALVLWFLSGRMLSAQVSFGKALEVSGLSTMISVLGGVVAILIMINFGRGGHSPGSGLAIHDLEAAGKGHLLPYVANAFAFWVVGVRSVGLAKLTGVPFLRAGWLVLTCWLLAQCFFALSGLGQLAM